MLRPPFSKVDVGLGSPGPHRMGKGNDGQYHRGVRPATAIVVLILLAAIAITGVVQLWLIFSPPG
jgi:hypothetical protein